MFFCERYSVSVLHLSYFSSFIVADTFYYVSCVNNRANSCFRKTIYLPNVITLRVDIEPLGAPVFKNSHCNKCLVPMLLFVTWPALSLCVLAPIAFSVYLKQKFKSTKTSIHDTTVDRYLRYNIYRQYKTRHCLVHVTVIIYRSIFM